MLFQKMQQLAVCGQGHVQCMSSPDPMKQENNQRSGFHGRFYKPDKLFAALEKAEAEAGVSP